MSQVITANALTHFGLPETATAFCWRIVPRLTDAPAQPALGIPPGYGEPEGYTSLDRDLVIDGLTYSSSANVMPTSIPCNIGLETDGVDATLLFPGAANVQQERAEMRVYDGALVHLFALPWEAFLAGECDSEDIARLLAGRLGSAQLDDGSATFELLTWSSLLNNSIGRITGELCDCARFGRGRCFGPGDGVDISAHGRTVAGTIVAPPAGHVANGMHLWVSLAESRAAGWANFGVLRLTSGPLAGAELPVKQFYNSGEIYLRVPSPIVPAVGTTLELEEGCDRTLGMCITKQPNPSAPVARGNSWNFRGFRAPGQKQLVKKKSVSKRPALIFGGD